MYTPIQQDAIENKIHEFMSRKSPTRTFSKTLAERISPSHRAKRRSSEITYEPLEWHQSSAAAHSLWQRAH